MFPATAPFEKSPDPTLLSDELTADLAKLDAVAVACCPTTTMSTILLVEALADKHPTDPEVLWRCTRLYYSVGEEFEGGAKASKPWYNQALVWAKAAVKIDLERHPLTDVTMKEEGGSSGASEKPPSENKKENSNKKKEAKAEEEDELPPGTPTNANVQLWYGIAVGGTVKSLPPKESIAQSHRIKTAFKVAIELAPGKWNSHHCYGALCYELSQLGWLARQAATVLFGAPPDSTLEEAESALYLGCSLATQQETPEHFRLWNYGYLGLTLSKMKTCQRAKEETEEGKTAGEGGVKSGENTNEELLAVDTKAEAKKYLALAVSIPDNESRARREFIKRCKERLGKL